MHFVVLKLPATSKFMAIVIVVCRMNADLSEVTPFIVSTEELRPEALGYDWMHKNLYWSSESKIEVVSVARKLRRNLIVSPNVTYAVSIAIDPRASQGYAMTRSYVFDIYMLS
jgi:hypothetical protein